MCGADGSVFRCAHFHRMQTYGRERCEATQITATTTTATTERKKMQYQAVSVAANHQPTADFKNRQTAIMQIKIS